MTYQNNYTNQVPPYTQPCNIVLIIISISITIYNIFFLIHILAFLPQKPPTAEQEFKRLVIIIINLYTDHIYIYIQVSEIKMQKEAEKQKEPDVFYDIPKCDIHPQKPSINCR